MYQKVNNISTNNVLCDTEGGVIQLGPAGFHDPGCGQLVPPRDNPKNVRKASWCGSGC